MSTTENNRIVWVDALKGWLIILVVLGHAIQSVMPEGCFSNHVWNYIYSFHMPAFMAVSGWLAFRRKSSTSASDYAKVCVRRARQLLVPFVIWTIISVLLNKHGAINAMVNSIIYPDRSFWFLWVLFWIFCIFKGLQLISSALKINENYAIIAVCLILMMLMAVLDIRVFGFQFIAYYFFFFSVGYFLHKYEVSDIKWYFLVLLFAIWVLVGWYWSMHSLPSWFPAVKHIPTTLLQYLYRALTATVAVVFLLCSKHVILNRRDKFNLWISDLGVVSLGIYTVHLTLLPAVTKILKGIFPGISDFAIVPILGVFLFLISLATVKLISKNRIAAEFLLGKVER